MIYLCIGLVIIVICLLILAFSWRKQRIIKDEQTLQENLQIRNEHTLIQTAKDVLDTQYHNLQIAVAELETNKSNLNTTVNDLNKQINTLTTTLSNTQQFYDDNYKAIEEKFDEGIEKLGQKYQEYLKQYQNEYFSSLQDLSSALQIETESYQVEVKNYEDTLASFRSKVDATVQASIRQEEMEQSQDFYRLQLTEADVNEIKKLREILPYFRNAEPLNKVIYKVYYEKPYSDLIGRVIGTTQKTGIYKITNIKNQRCYVGQAVNIAERWKQHIKRGVGAEAPTQNKLYPIMYAEGPENFTFEIIEECARPQLNEREDYWQEVFHAKDFGYSIK